jgi:hypothetical protein
VFRQPTPRAETYRAGSNVCLGPLHEQRPKPISCCEIWLMEAEEASGPISQVPAKVGIKGYAKVRRKRMSRSSTNVVTAMHQRSHLVNRQRQNQLSYRARQHAWNHNAGVYYLTRYVWKFRK